MSFCLARIRGSSPANQLPRTLADTPHSSLSYTSTACASCVSTPFIKFQTPRSIAKSEAQDHHSDLKNNFKISKENKKDIQSTCFPTQPEAVMALIQETRICIQLPMNIYDQRYFSLPSLSHPIASPSSSQSAHSSISTQLPPLILQSLIPDAETSTLISKNRTRTTPAPPSPKTTWTPQSIKLCMPKATRCEKRLLEKSMLQTHSRKEGVIS
jgi:hypothetical protein